ncbi:unnamed protein product [Rotaria socialis]|nr:unnamed protein product [Rotaria socialis]
MAPWGLRVSTIEPGFMRTPILESTSISFEDLWSSLSKDVQMRWGEDFVKEKLSKKATSLLIKYAENPMKVVRALQHAIINTKPSIRYRPGWQSSFIFSPVSMMPAWITDWILNKLDNLSVLPASVYKQLKD